MTTPEAKPSMLELIAMYGDPMRVIDRIPRGATELYWRWSDRDGPRNSLTRRERRERRLLARYLQHVLAKKGTITRAVITERGATVIAFYLPVDSDAAPRDQPRRAAHGVTDRRSHGRGVVQ